MIKPNRQTDLFKHQLIESGCSLHQADLLFKENLLSFNPEGKEEYEGFEIEELKFLKCLYFDPGLPINIVKAMLGKLEKPYSYSFGVIYWDYGSQEWKELPQDAEDYVNDNLKDIVFDNFDEFLENIKVGDIENLSSIGNSINKLIEKLKSEKNIIKIKMLGSLFKKARYGTLVNLKKYIQIPILQNSHVNIINENPYIKLEDIHSEYELVKGKAAEIDFWEKVKFMFEQGKISGYEDKEVYPINKEQAIVDSSKNYATFYFWNPDVELENDEEGWLWDNAEKYELYINGNPTSIEIYISDINKISEDKDNEQSLAVDFAELERGDIAPDALKEEDIHSSFKMREFNYITVGKVLLELNSEIQEKTGERGKISRPTFYRLVYRLHLPRGSKPTEGGEPIPETRLKRLKKRLRRSIVYYKFKFCFTANEKINNV